MDTHNARVPFSVAFALVPALNSNTTSPRHNSAALSNHNAAYKTQRRGAIALPFFLPTTTFSHPPTFVLPRLRLRVLLSRLALVNLAFPLENSRAGSPSEAHQNVF